MARCRHIEKLDETRCDPLCMSNTLNPSDEERVSIGIDNAFEFVREVLDDPTILEQLPDGSHLKVVSRDQQDPSEHYDVTTPNIAVKVTSSPRPEQR